MTDGSIYLVIAGTFFGFTGLAFILLFPVYRFMKRQERLADDWTDDAIRRRATASPPRSDSPRLDAEAGDAEPSSSR